MSNISQVHKGEGIDGVADNSEDWELEKLAFYVHMERLAYLDKVSAEETAKAADSQAIVAKLYNLIGRINEITDKEKGTIKVEKGSELEKLLKEAQKEGVNISKFEGEFNEREVQRLLENIKYVVEERNAFGSNLTQKLQRFINERYEMYTMTGKFQKGWHDDKTNKARAIKGG